jgi:ribosomal-protein-alanine N-acetyltransferase
LNDVNENNKLEVSIREMTKADLPQVVSLEKQIFPDPWPRSVFLEQITDGNWGAIVAEVDEKIIGYACYFYTDDECHLTNIAVDPACRRKSVARKLLVAILTIVQESGCEYLLLEVRSSNVEAQAFYERFGFTLLYRKPNYYRHPVEDALVLVLFLKDSKEV